MSEKTETATLPVDPALSLRDKRILETALAAGVLLMENGAETYRVEDTVERILSLSNHETVDVVALLTGLYVTLTLQNGELLSAIRRIKKHEVRLNRIAEVNEISRHLVEKRLTVQQAYEKLQALRVAPEEKKHQAHLMAISAAGFALMCGATWQESIIGGIAALGTVLVDSLLKHRLPVGFFVSFSKSFIVAAILCVVSRLFPVFRLSFMAIGSLIMLFPGTTFTTGIRDTMKGDYLTGGGNLLAALISAMALGAGTALAMLLIGGKFV